MDKFWTKSVEFFDKVGWSFFSWSPKNIETLLLQAFVDIIIFWFMWDYSAIWKVMGVGNFAIYLPINLFFLLKK